MGLSRGTRAGIQDDHSDPDEEERVPLSERLLRCRAGFAEARTVTYTTPIYPVIDPMSAA